MPSKTCRKRNGATLPLDNTCEIRSTLVMAIDNEKLMLSMKLLLHALWYKQPIIHTNEKMSVRLKFTSDLSRQNERNNYAHTMTSPDLNTIDFQ